MAKFSQKQGKRKRNGCLLGVGTVVFLLVSGIYFALEPVRETKRLEQVLIERFGPASQFTPAMDGAVPPHRIEAFVRVRESVQPNCVEYQAVLDSVINIETLETDEALSGDEKVSQGLSGFKNLIGAPPKMVKFIDTRNSSLLAEEMGLGEYLYLYLAAYGSQLAAESTGKYSQMEEASISKRSRKDFLQILQNQLSVVQAMQRTASTTMVITELQRELSAFEEGSHSSPWPNGPGGLTGESLSPYKQQLSELYCSGIVRVELLQKR